MPSIVVDPPLELNEESSVICRKRVEKKKGDRGKSGGAILISGTLQYLLAFFRSDCAFAYRLWL